MQEYYASDCRTNDLIDELEWRGFSVRENFDQYEVDNVVRMHQQGKDWQEKALRLLYDYAGIIYMGNK